MDTLGWIFLWILIPGIIIYLINLGNEKEHESDEKFKIYNRYSNKFQNEIHSGRPRWETVKMIDNDKDELKEIHRRREDKKKI